MSKHKSMEKEPEPAWLQPPQPVARQLPQPHARPWTQLPVNIFDLLFSENEQQQKQKLPLATNDKDKPAKKKTWGKRRRRT